MRAKVESCAERGNLDIRRSTINAYADAGMLCCTRNSGDPETTLQSLERIDDGSTRLGHAASILWASADGQDPAATSCIGLNRTECRCLSHSVRGRRVGGCFRHMVEGRRSMQVILRTNAVSCRAMPGAGVCGMGAITASAGSRHGRVYKKGQPIPSGRGGCHRVMRVLLGHGTACKS